MIILFIKTRCDPGCFHRGTQCRASFSRDTAVEAEIWKFQLLPRDDSDGAPLAKRLLYFNEKLFRVWRPGRHREVFKRSKERSMRSPWVGSLALLAPAHGFVSQSMVSRGNILMLQAFARPVSTSAFRAATRGWSQRTVKLRRIAPHGGVARTASGPSGGSGGGGGDQAKKNKPKKPESYYKNTVILPQTDFQQVRSLPSIYCCPTVLRLTGTTSLISLQSTYSYVGYCFLSGRYICKRGY